MSSINPSSHSNGTELQPVIFVLGADNLLGKATVNALLALEDNNFQIKAGVKNVEKFSTSLKWNATFVQAETGNQQVEMFAGVNTLCLICPTSLDRVKLTMNTMATAKEAGVQHILLYSLLTADLADTIFGKQFGEIEAALSKLGVPFTILRLPLYMDNYYAYEATVKMDHAFSGPLDPNMAYTPVAVDDAALVAAVILKSPEKHAGKTYPIVSDRHTFRNLAAAFTKVLNHEVTYTRVPYDQSKALLQQHKFPEWQAEGIMEMYRLVDQGSRVTDEANVNLFEEITGKKPTSHADWVTKYADVFK